MKSIQLVLVALALTAISDFLSVSAFEAGPKPPRVLIVTGADVPAHDWRATTPVTRSILEEGKRFETFVSEEPSVLETAALQSYDVLVLNYRNPPDAKLSDTARKNILEFLGKGKGLVLIHFAVAAFSDWEEYSKIAGRVWVGKKGNEKISGHGDRGKFLVKITAKDHPITAGVSDFTADDELYARLQGDAPIEVLATAFSSDYSKKDEPMAWTLPYGKGRVFVTPLGHDAVSRSVPAFQRLLQQGTLWAAGRSGK